MAYVAANAKATTPLDLRARLSPSIFMETIIQENKVVKGNQRKDQMPKGLYVFKFVPPEGSEVPLSAVEFDALCELARGRDFCLHEMKMGEKGSIESMYASGLEKTLIPNGLARESPKEEGMFVIGEAANTGKYFAEITK